MHPRRTTRTPRLRTCPSLPSPHAAPAECWAVGRGGVARQAGRVEERIVSLVDLASYVARHGYKVEDHTLVAPSDQVAQAICSKAADVGSTLIVAGAYSRQRWIEQLFGGVTQSLFLQTRHPVLFAR